MSKILDALDEQQRAAASCVAGPVVIFAGAGTGKTRTITHRIAHVVESRVADPSAILAVTFTTRAAGELRGRLSSLGVDGAQVRTFHSAAYRQLRFFYPQVFNSPMPELVVSKAKFVGLAVESCGIAMNKDTVRDLASEIEWAKVNLLSPDTYRTAGKGRTVGDGITADEVARVYESYLSIMDDSNVMDYEDVLLTTTAMLANYPEVAAAIHKQYRHFTVDEFQDVSPAQFELLKQWLGGRQDVCVVGDPAQTIYSFSGATNKYLREFSNHFTDAQYFELTHSYRSTPQIIETANKILAKDFSGAVKLKAQRPAGPKVTVRTYNNDELEARTVASQIATLVSNGTSPRDIAVLYRTNSQSEILEAELASAHVPVTLRGAERFFERPEVKLAILNLRAAAQGNTERAISASVRDTLGSAGWKVRPPDTGRAARETWESLNTLVGLADDFEAERPGTVLADFIAALDKRNELEHVPSANAVTLASIHAAKGLEWEAVFVVGLSDGLLPITYAKTPEQIAEERRLLYVAVTRAKSHLHLSWASSRHAEGRGNRDASPFLDELSRA